jgi:hypothetical protein
MAINATSEQDKSAGFSPDHVFFIVSFNPRDVLLFPTQQAATRPLAISCFRLYP